MCKPGDGTASRGWVVCATKSNKNQYPIYEKTFEKQRRVGSRVKKKLAWSQGEEFRKTKKYKNGVRLKRKQKRRHKLAHIHRSEVRVRRQRGTNAGNAVEMRRIYQMLNYKTSLDITDNLLLKIFVGKQFMRQIDCMITTCIKMSFT